MKSIKNHFKEMNKSIVCIDHCYSLNYTIIGTLDSIIYIIEYDSNN
jgi:hypothetical protein